MSEERTIGYCPNCGTKYSDDAKFCSGCGARIRTQQEESAQGSAGATGAGAQTGKRFDDGFQSILNFLDQTDYVPYEAEENRLIGTKVEYYRGKFDEMRMLNQKTSLNWAALFFGVLWMLYRKMYGVAAGTVVLMLLGNCLGSLGGLVGIVLMVCSGLFGNYLYMMTIQKRVTDLQQYEEPARTRYLEKYQGTSGLAVLIGLVAVSIASFPFWLLMAGLNLLMFL